MTVNREMIYCPFKENKKVDLGNNRLINLFHCLGKLMNISQKSYFQKDDIQEHGQEQSSWI